MFEDLDLILEEVLVDDRDSRLVVVDCGSRPRMPVAKPMRFPKAAANPGVSNVVIKERIEVGTTPLEQQPADRAAFLLEGVQQFNVVHRC